MQMPCRLFYSAWHLFRRSNCADVYWTSDAPGEIRTPDPQIRSLRSGDDWSWPDCPSAQRGIRVATSGRVDQPSQPGAGPPGQAPL